MRPTLTTFTRKRICRTWTLEMCVCGRLTKDRKEEEESDFPWWYSPQTFASNLGPGSERECWRRATFLAAASPKSLSAGAGAAESPLFASRHLSAGGKQTQRRHKLLISCHSVLYLLVLQYLWGVGGGLTNLLSFCHFSIRQESQSDKQPMTYSVKPEVVHYKSTY